jgi:hypothetical protein
MTLIEWTTSQSTSTTYQIPYYDALLRGTGSKEITLTYTGSGNQAIVKVKPNMELSPPNTWWETTTIENLIIDGQNIAGTTGVLLEDVYNCSIRNLTIKNCDIGIKLSATDDRFSEANSIQHVRMENVGKGIVFDNGNLRSGSFAFTTIDDVGIVLKDNSGSVGIEIGAGNDANHVCTPYNSIIRANVWMGPNNPGTGMSILKKTGSPSIHGSVTGSLASLAVFNQGENAGGTGINLNDGTGGVIRRNQNNFLLVI